MRTKTIAERLDSKIDRSGGPAACWPWIGARRHEYGVLFVGERILGAHRLVDDAVRAIRAAHIAGEGQRPIARRFGISRIIVRHVIAGTRWRHVA